MKEQKKRRGKTITIVMLIFLLLISIAYITYDHYMDLSKREKKIETKKKTKLYYDEVQEMMRQIEMYNQVFQDVSQINDIKNLDNQLKLKFGIYALQEVENIHNYYQVEDIKEMYHRYFINGFDAIYEDIDCPVKDKALYQYHSDTKTFTEESGHDHGKATVDINTYLVNGEIKDGKYIITTHILYSNYCNEMCNPDEGYYQSYSDIQKGINKVMSKQGEYKDHKDELPYTIYIFNYEKGKYKLEKIKMSN